MIFLNIIGIMRRVDPANTEEYDRRARECTDRIVNEHYRPELGCTLDGIVKVKERYTHFGSDEHALIPALQDDGKGGVRKMWSEGVIGIPDAKDKEKYTK